jgi:hypothetical protein
MKQLILTSPRTYRLHRRQFHLLAPSTQIPISDFNNGPHCSIFPHHNVFLVRPNDITSAHSRFANIHFNSPVLTFTFRLLALCPLSAFFLHQSAVVCPIIRLCAYESPLPVHESTIESILSVAESTCKVYSLCHYVSVTEHPSLFRLGSNLINYVHSLTGFRPL